MKKELKLDKETLRQNGCVDSLQMSDALCHKVVISNGPRPCMWIASRGTVWLGNHLWKAIAFGFLLCLISENVLLGMFLAFINGGLLGWR